VGRFFIYNFADIRDYKKFPKHDIAKGETSYHFIGGAAPGSVKLPKSVSIKKKAYDFERFLNKSNTVAFLVIRNDSLLYEQYLDGYNKSSIVPSFSVAKSFTSILMGIAIKEGYITSVDDPVTKYLPELKENGFDQVTIEWLLDMRSGVKFNEGYYNPFGDVAKYYYGRKIKKYVRKLKLAKEPGREFDYKSVNTQLLGMIIERATKMSLSQYMQEKVWRHIGAEYDASWSIDSRKDDQVKAFCCFNARAVDYAKVGRLYLNNGNWNGEQVVPAAWVRQSLNVSSGKNGSIYSYQWWHNDAQDFMAEGILGQFVYVYPAKNIIIVRLGSDGYGAWSALLRAIAEKN
jgi:CubicO group peptidase (beta-lactamase class C family)